MRTKTRLVRPRWRIAAAIVAVLLAGSATAVFADEGDESSASSAGGSSVPAAVGPEQLIGANLQPVWSPSDQDTWPQTTYDAIKAKGFSSVRFVLFWDDFEPVRGQWNETAFATLSMAFDRAQAAGLLVVIDAVHLYGQPEGQSRVPEWARTTDGMGAVAQNGLGFLRQLASRFGQHPALAAYDPVNEPYRWPLDHRSVLADYTTIVDAIRAGDTDTLIMIEPTYGDARPTEADFEAFDPVSRDNLVWSIHDYYQGGAGDGYDDDGGGHSPNPSDGTTGYNPADKADLEAHLNVQLDLAAAAGMQVWIGEFGIGINAAGHDQYIKDKVELYRAKGVGYAWWEFYDDGTFSMIDGSDNWRPWVDFLVP